MISDTEKSKLTNCLDLLGVALATHGHNWTDEERQAYEEATALLAVPGTGSGMVGKGELVWGDRQAGSAPMAAIPDFTGGGFTG